MKKISVLLVFFFLIGSSFVLTSVYAYTPILERVSPTPKTYPANDPSGFYQMSYSGSGDVTASLQAIDLIMPPTGGSTSGCEAADFAGFVPGRIALIQRGTCTFALKAQNAEAAGAVGVIIFNEGDTSYRLDAIKGTLGGPGINIPVVGTSFAIGDELYTLSLQGNVVVHMMVESASVWQADKSADQSEVILAIGQQLPVNYTVTVDVEYEGGVDNCIEVTDTLEGSLGTVCIQDAPKTFTYSRNIGPYDVCGEYAVTNTVSFVTDDTGAIGGDLWTVTVDVPCGGCTLSQGYWKTHSELGPAPYDNAWAMLPNGASTVFFLSGKTWYQILVTPPAAGNAYYILAHQYIAAKLNMLNAAASTPEINAAIAWATNFFNTYTPLSKLNKSVQITAVSYASLLDQYNNGFIGPVHCSE